MNVGSLFSGIGGLDKGLADAGHRHVFFCESDPYRRDVLAARWPGVPIYDDVRAVRSEPDADAGRLDHGELGAARRGERDHVTERHEVSRGGVDLLCGGFPCQDVSVAGRRAGLAGERSGLFFEFARIVDAVRPGWILVENVPGLLSSNGGWDFGAVVGTLADLGYGVAWRILDSRFFGVPQRRRRVFILGAVADGDPRAAAERAGQVLAVGSRCERHPATGSQAGQDVAGTLGGGAGERGWAQDVERMTFLPTATGFHMLQDPISEPELAPAWGKGNKQGSASIGVSFTPAVSGTLKGFGKRGWENSAESADRLVEASSTGVRRLTPRECERLQGLPDDWTKLDDKTPDSRRYSALGDAVTASVAEWIGRRFP